MTAPTAPIETPEDIISEAQSAAIPLFAMTGPWGNMQSQVYSRLKDYFVYNIVALNLAASATTSGSAMIQNDSDFMWTQATAIVTVTNQTTFVGPDAVPILFQIQDSSSGRYLSDQPMSIGAQFGTARQPFVLTPPRLFARSGQLTVTLQNLDAGNAYWVRLSFIGFKVFSAPMP
jgi:hypothetical protein